ncbi:MAG: hypothetical protein IT440_13455, partial [Phycisphaeraceae bacterium]|nr:hypothetical protein [Phycisphaeraceae bacterium]
TQSGAQNGALPPVDPDIKALADALDALPESDRAAVVEHVRALIAMTPAKRAALLTLTT